jgi:hypothetical protein
MASDPRRRFAGQRHLLRLAGKTARGWALFPGAVAIKYLQRDMRL